MRFSFSGHQQMSLPGGPQMNKFEKVSSDCHLMALAGGGTRSRGVSGLMSRGGCWGG